MSKNQTKTVGEVARQLNSTIDEIKAAIKLLKLIIYKDKSNRLHFESKDIEALQSYFNSDSPHKDPPPAIQYHDKQYYLSLSQEFEDYVKSKLTFSDLETINKIQSLSETVNNVNKQCHELENYLSTR